MAYFDSDRANFAVLATDINEINPEESAFFYMNRASHEQFGTELEGKKIVDIVVKTLGTVASGKDYFDPGILQVFLNNYEDFVRIHFGSKNTFIH